MVRVEDFDHPVVFVALMAIAVMCMSTVFTWGAKAWNLPGVASVMQHP